MVIRKAQIEDIPAIAKVHIASWQSTYAGLLADEFLSSLSSEEREQMWQNALSSSASEVSLYVAETPDRRVVGFAAGGPERTGDSAWRGEIYAIYLLQSQQRRRVGSILLKALVRELVERGLTPLLVWVLRANPACRFYERLDGKYVREKEIEIGHQRLTEVAYGWEDARTLLAEGNLS
jgi:L-amino acid N-acyltransferase YncA